MTVLYVFQGGRAAVPFPPAPGWLRAVWGVVQGGLRHRILLGVRRTSKHLFGKPVYFSSSSRDYDSESHFELAQRLHPEYFSLLPDKDDVFPHHFHDMMGGDYVRLWGIRQLTYSRKMSVWISVFSARRLLLSRLGQDVGGGRIRSSASKMADLIYISSDFPSTLSFPEIKK